MGVKCSTRNVASLPVQAERKRKGYYQQQDLDGYSRMRASDGVEAKQLDNRLLAAVSECLQDDGKIDEREVREVILPKIANGSATCPSLSCNQRWTIRYALSEYMWDDGARRLIIESMKGTDIQDVDCQKIEDAAERARALEGPPLKELMLPPEKTARVPEGRANPTVVVDGMILDRAMLRACAENVKGEEHLVDALEAIKVFVAAANDGVLSCCERWTLRFLLSAYHFTPAAASFLVEALSKMQQTD